MIEAWLASDDPVLAQAARDRLARQAGHVPPRVASEVERMKACPHWSVGVSCCGGWKCLRDPDDIQTIQLSDCTRCPEFPGE